MILVLDNYDSFTWNLVHYLMELGVEVAVHRNDALTAAEALASGAEAILISPGPGTPDEAGITLDLVAACAATATPLLGVCLGHQAIGQHFGGRVVRGHLMHGKTSPIHHDATGVFAGLPSPYEATRYHSLVVEAVPPALQVNATADDTAVMGLRHATLPIHGVQFHPESIATQHGHALLANFLALAKILPGTGRGRGRTDAPRASEDRPGDDPTSHARAARGRGGPATIAPPPHRPLHQTAADPPPRSGEDHAA